MEKTLLNKLSNEEYEVLIAKTFEGTIVKEKTRSKYSSKIDEIIKDEIENLISEKLSAIRVDFKNSQSN